jgi:hypothetical protein
VATHVIASLTSLRDQSFCTRTHKIPSPPHGTSTLEQAPVCTWNMSSSDDDVLALAVFVLMCKRKPRKKKRDVWCKDWLMKKKTYSHIKLLSELKTYPRDWHNYLRMNEETYLNLSSLLTPLIKKQGMIMREAATPHGRLPATLRFFATGRSYEDLKYSTSTKVWAPRSHLYHCQSNEILQNFSSFLYN